MSAGVREQDFVLLKPGRYNGVDRVVGEILTGDEIGIHAVMGLLNAGHLRQYFAGERNDREQERPGEEQPRHPLVPDGGGSPEGDARSDGRRQSGRAGRAIRPEPPDGGGDASGGPEPEPVPVASGEAARGEPVDGLTGGAGDSNEPDGQRDAGRKADDGGRPGTGPATGEHTDERAGQETEALNYQMWQQLRSERPRQPARPG